MTNGNAHLQENNLQEKQSRTDVKQLKLRNDARTADAYYRSTIPADVGTQPDFV